MGGRACRRRSRSPTLTPYRDPPSPLRAGRKLARPEVGGAQRAVLDLGRDDRVVSKLGRADAVSGQHADRVARAGEGDEERQAGDDEGRGRQLPCAFAADAALPSTLPPPHAAAPLWPRRSPSARTAAATSDGGRRSRAEAGDERSFTMGRATAAPVGPGGTRPRRYPCGRRASARGGGAGARRSPTPLGGRPARSRGSRADRRRCAAEGRGARSPAFRSGRSGSRAGRPAFAVHTPFATTR